MAKNKIPERRRGLERTVEVNLDVYGRNESAGNNLLPAKKDEIFFDDVIVNNLNFKEIFNLTESEEINNFLISKSTELYKLHSKTAIELGKIFVDVEDKLSGSNQYDGVYTKWLDRNGFNKMTALRYKRRYRLFEQLETTIGKNILMTLSQKLIDEISSKEDEEIKRYLKLLDEGKTKTEIQEKLVNKTDKIEIINNIEFDLYKNFEKINNTLKNISIDNLDEKKKENLEKDFQKIEKILDKYI